MLIQNLLSKSFSVATPYIIPNFLDKKVNAGDGFIYDSSIKLIGYNPKYIFSTREILTEEKINLINTTKLLIITGANIIKDRFEIITGFDLQTLMKIKVPIVLMGIGHYGLSQTNKNGFDTDSKYILTEILSRFPQISVRCNGSYKYIENCFNKIIKNIFNTSCPVIYNLDGVNKNFKKKNKYRQLVVTLTDRSNLKEQLPILNFAKNFFKSKINILALHQNFENKNFENYAKSQGYEVFSSKNYENFIELYKNTDIHFGNRVHAHLKCLSMGIPSFCTPFDLRQLYFSESIGLPLIIKQTDDHLRTFNFERFTSHQNQSKKIMDNFVKLIKNNL